MDDEIIKQALVTIRLEDVSIRMEVGFQWNVEESARGEQVSDVETQPQILPECK